MPEVDVQQLDAAAAALRNGDLVAFPTETVYGLGADASNPAALAKIFALKGRPADHPLIVHIGEPAHLECWAREVPETARRLAARFWPGPLTLVLRRNAGVPDLVTGGQDTVAVRMPGHAVALALLRAFGGGIAAPSANRFGRVSPTTAAHVREEFGMQAPLVLDGGPCTVGVESTILSLVSDPPVLLRPGGLTTDMLAEVLGTPPANAAAAKGVRAPGMLEAHYAPATPLALADSDGVWAVALEAADEGARVTVMTHAPGHAPGEARDRAHVEAMPANAEDYARQLYAVLRRLDREGFGRIIVETPPTGAAWDAVADRLRRAARGAAPGGTT